MEGGTGAGQSAQKNDEIAAEIEHSVKDTRLIHDTPNNF